MACQPCRFLPPGAIPSGQAHRHLESPRRSGKMFCGIISLLFATSMPANGWAAYGPYCAAEDSFGGEYLASGTVEILLVLHTAMDRSFPNSMDHGFPRF